MELIPECHLFREISAFQKIDFETNWAEANPLPGKEQDLFTLPPQKQILKESFDDMDFNFQLFERDPMLSKTLEDEEPFATNIINDAEASFDLIEPPPSSSLASPPEVIYYTDSEEEPDHDSVQTSASEVKLEPSEPFVKKQRNSPFQTRPRQKRRPQRSRDDESLVIFRNGKPKLYAESPFKNPQLERARLNAINAKKNRDKKKLENARIQMEMMRLRDQNNKIERSRQRFEMRAAQAERELAAIKELLQSANLGDLLKLVSGN